MTDLRCTRLCTTPGERVCITARSCDVESQYDWYKNLGRSFRPTRREANGIASMAEGEGFEPPVEFPPQRFSRPPVSTAHPSLRRLV
jgi:hypothetical protein